MIINLIVILDRVNKISISINMLNMKRSIKLSLLFLINVIFSQNLNAQKISTFAGGGAGDGMPATAVGMTPFGVGADAIGNVYIADMNNNRVLKVNTSGRLSTIAGTGTSGYNGDSISASSARLCSPTGVTVDNIGNVYIADKCNGLVRKVNVAGIISTIAGGGSVLGDGGPATNAILSNPFAVALDAIGNLYIADAVSSRVRKVDTMGIINTIAGTGTAGYSGDGGPGTNAMLQNPSGVVIDAIGNVYIADIGGKRVRKLDTGGIITTFAGNGVAGITGDHGSATAAELYNPSSVSIDNLGNVYITDQTYGYVRKVDTSGIINYFAGGGGLITEGIHADSAELYQTSGIIYDGVGNLYVVDKGLFRVRKINVSGIINTVAGNMQDSYLGDNYAASAAGLQYPCDVATDASGNLYIADQTNNRIRKIDNLGIITTIAGNDTLGFTGDGGPATSAQIYSPIAVATDISGNIYFSDHHNQRIRKINSSGSISTIAGTGTIGFSGDGGPATAAMIAYPYQITTDIHGSIYFADEGNNRIRKINSTGIISTIAGCSSTSGFGGDGGPATLAHLRFPTGVAVDRSGNVYIADMINNRVRKLDTFGIINTIAGTSSSGYSGDGIPATSAELYEPMSLKFDSAGNLYIVDYGNNMIRMVDTAGIINAVAGSYFGGSFGGYSGDGGPATAAKMHEPCGIAFDGCNSIYVADAYNNVIRKISLIEPVIGSTTICSGAITTLIDSTTSGFWNIGGTTSICSIDSGSGELRGLTSGVALITYTTTNTCGVAFANATITVNPLPDSGIISGLSLVAVGSAIMLSDTVTAGIWSSGNATIATVSSTGLVTGVSMGVDTISYTVTNLCGHSSAIKTITVTPTLGLSTKNSFINSFNIYPNPATNKITIESQQQGRIQIVSLDGQLILSELLKEKSTQFTLPIGIANGTYLVRFISIDGICNMQKLYIER